MLKRKTLKKMISFEGTGLHSGEKAECVLKPTGRKGFLFSFQDGDTFGLDEGHMEGSGRCTTIFFPNGKTVMTPEHLLAALYAHGIDDVEIKLRKGAEIPAMDGSALAFSSAILESGSAEKDDPRESLSIPVPLGIDDPDNRSMIWAFPHESLKITCVIDFPNSLIGTSCFSMEIEPSSFHSDIAPARTFALERDIAYLKEKGLARGGSFDNAVLVEEERILASGGLRFENEFVRHKILDLIGDLALLGMPLQAHVFAFRCGHRYHLDLVRRISSVFDKHHLRGVDEGVRYTQDP